MRRHGPHPIDEPGRPPEGASERAPESPETAAGSSSAAEEERILRPEEVEEIIELGEEDVIEELDVDVEELSDEDIEPIEAPAVERRESKEDIEARARERRALKNALTEKDLGPEAMLEMLAVHDKEAMESPETLDELALITEEYGLDVKDIDDTEQKRLLVIYNGIKRSDREQARENMGEVLERVMHERLADQAFTRIDALNEALARSSDLATLRARLEDSMRSLSAVASQIRAAEGGIDETFMDVVDRFNEVVAYKKHVTQAAEPVEVRGSIREAFDSIFEEYKDFIEDDIVAFEIMRMKKGQGRSSSVEHVMHSIYGRSKEEVELKKSGNREKVAEAIAEMAKKPYPTVEMLEKLHEINNDGLMPRDLSKLREGDEVVFFGKIKRLGTLGPDVRPVVEDILERATDLIDRKAVSKVSARRYEIEAAGLHNDLLDVHPFVDRNGSTSLLFLELMMAMRGEYEPTKEREKDYYKKLAKVVGYNPAAVAAVGYEMAKMTYVSGFYEKGLSEERRAEHQSVVELVARLRAEGKLK